MDVGRLLGVLNGVEYAHAACECAGDVEPPVELAAAGAAAAAALAATWYPSTEWRRRSIPCIIAPW